MAENVPLNTVKLVTDESGRVTGVEDLESERSVPIGEVLDSSKFVCEEQTFSPIDSEGRSPGDKALDWLEDLKRKYAPFIKVVEGIYEGAKELYGKIAEKVKEDAVVKNMEKGAKDCATKRDTPVKKGSGSGKKGDGIVNEVSVCDTSNDDDGPSQTTTRKDELSGDKADGDRKAGREEAIRAEGLRTSSGKEAIGEVETARSKKEGVLARTATVPPDRGPTEDKPASVDGDKKAERAIKDNAERTKEIEQEIAVERTNAMALQEKADNDKAGSKEVRDNGISREDAGDGHLSDIDSISTQDDRACDRTTPEAFGEHWSPLIPSPFIPNDSVALANGFNPLMSVAVRMEDLFPAIVQNFVGCFAYLQFHKNVNENDAKTSSHTQAATGERGKAVWAAGKKEGGDNRSDHGGSPGQGQQQRD